MDDGCENSNNFLGRIQTSLATDSFSDTWQKKEHANKLPEFFDVFKIGCSIDKQTYISTLENRLEPYVPTGDISVIKVIDSSTSDFGVNDRIFEHFIDLDAEISETRSIEMITVSDVDFYSCASTSDPNDSSFENVIELYSESSERNDDEIIIVSDEDSPTEGSSDSCSIDCDPNANNFENVIDLCSEDETIMVNDVEPPTDEISTRKMFDSSSIDSNSNAKNFKNLFDLYAETSKLRANKITGSFGKNSSIFANNDAALNELTIRFTILKNVTFNEKLNSAFLASLECSKNVNESNIVTSDKPQETRGNVEEHADECLPSKYDEPNIATNPESQDIDKDQEISSESNVDDVFLKRRAGFSEESELVGWDKRQKLLEVQIGSNDNNKKVADDSGTQSIELTAGRVSFEDPVPIDKLSDENCIGQFQFLNKCKIMVDELNSHGDPVQKMHKRDINMKGIIETHKENVDPARLASTSKISDIAEKTTPQARTLRRSERIKYAKENVRLSKYRTKSKKIESCVCPICHKTYSCIREKRRHVARHLGVKKHKCELCGALFFSKTELRRHFAKHSKERMYKCEKCDKTYCHYPSKFNHFKKKHMI